MDETREDPRLIEIRNWIAKLRKLLALGGGAAIASAMPGLQKDLQSLAGKEGADMPVAAQLKVVLSRLAEDIQPGESKKPRASREELLKLQALLESERRSFETLLKELGPVLTPQEASMFQMTLEMVGAQDELQQFDSALALLNQASLKAWEIVDEGRSPKGDEDEEPPVDLGPVVQTATETLGRLLAPWAPLLTEAFQIQSALFASMLNRCLKEQAHGPALGLISAWAESVQDLARQLRERIVLELAQYEPPEGATPQEAQDVWVVREKILAILSNPELEAADIQAAQQLLDRLPTLIVEAQEAIDRRARLAEQWQLDLAQAREAMKRELDKINTQLHPQVKKRLKGEPAWELYTALFKRTPDGDYEALTLELAQACEGLVGLLGSIALELQPALSDAKGKEKDTASNDEVDDGADEEATDFPHAIDSVADLVRAYPPLEKDDMSSYLERQDVIDFLGDNWLSHSAHAELAELLDPAPVVKKPSKGRSSSSSSAPDEADEDTGGWKVIEDDPRTYFTDAAALDKAKRIIEKVKAGMDPRKAATEEGCSTPTWYGDMLEIRLTQGGTQLRLIAYNRGKGQLAFTEIKSFHAAGDKKAGKLSDY